MSRRVTLIAIALLSGAALVIAGTIDVVGSPALWALVGGLVLFGVLVSSVVSADHAIGVFALVVFVGSALAGTLAAGNTPQLGLDLRGGFQVRLESPEGTDPDILDKAVEIMDRRVEALGNVAEPDIRREGDRTIVVALPGVSDRERALAAVGTTGTLEFRPVLDIGLIPGISPLLTDASVSTPTDGEDGGDGSITLVPGGILLPAGITFCVADAPNDQQVPGCIDSATGITLVSDPTKEAWMATQGPDGQPGVVYYVAPARVLGSDLASADARFQSSGGGHSGGFGLGGGGTGEWVVILDFNSEGSTKFEDVSKELAGFPLGSVRRQFAIVLDVIVQSAPQIAASVSPEEGIAGGNAVITVGSSDDPESEAQDLAVVLRYGALPVAFEQSAAQSVSATLGSDSLQAGLIAGIGGLLLVAVAMIFYYRALGVVNVVGLGIFGSIMLVTYSVLGSLQGVTLTLAGVAGVIVAVGITSDSYIVYYERIKEEVHKGRSLRGAIDHAFTRSFRTILTADFVSFLGAAVLFTLAIGSVKGFALALLIATIADVFVAYFFTRPAVAMVARSRFGDGGVMSIRGATGKPVEASA